MMADASLFNSIALSHRFGVVDHNCTDIVELHTHHVQYNGVSRGQPAVREADVPAYVHETPYYEGKQVMLLSKATNKHLRLESNGIVDGLGGEGAMAKWVILPNNGHVRFNNVHNPALWLAIKGNQLTFGEGG